MYLTGHHREAAGALLRASRWGTTEKPLYLAQAALARHAAGEAGSELAQHRERLADAPCGQGYGQFVLGELCYLTSDFAAARQYLRLFIKRTTSGRVALEVALSGESRMPGGCCAPCAQSSAAPPSASLSNATLFTPVLKLLTGFLGTDIVKLLRRSSATPSSVLGLTVALLGVILPRLALAAPAGADAFTRALEKGPLYAALAAFAGGSWSA